MFESSKPGFGLLPGESDDELAATDETAYLLTCREMADGWAHPERHVLPDGLEEIVPGPYLAAIVSSADSSKLNGHDVVRLMQSRSRLSAHDEAGKLAAMAEVAHAPPCDPESGVLRSTDEVEYAAVEVAAALTLTRRMSEIELSRAVSLTGRLVRVWRSMSRGDIDLGKAKIFDLTLGHLPAETVNAVLNQVLDEATGLTTGQLRARLGRLVLEIDPDGTKSSYEEELEERNVAVGSNPDHTANFSIYSAPPEDVTAARANVESIARSLKTREEPRTLEQIRADVALDLLMGRHFAESSGGGRVDVTVPALTLAGLSDEPGHLGGFGPVFAEIARKTVRENIDGEWVFTVTDNGCPVGSPRALSPDARLRLRSEGYVLSTRPVCSPAVASPPSYVTWTIDAHIHEAVPPTTTTSVLCVATITWSDTINPGCWNDNRPATTCGPAHSGTLTPANVRHPIDGGMHWQLQKDSCSSQRMCTRNNRRFTSSATGATIRASSKRCPR